MVSDLQVFGVGIVLSAGLFLYYLVRLVIELRMDRTGRMLERELRGLEALMDGHEGRRRG